jgi:hypothetical protein
MHRIIAAIIAATVGAACSMPLPQAQAGDASLLIENRVVRQSVSATPPGAAINPQDLLGTQIWYGTRSGSVDSALLRSAPSDGAEIEGVQAGLTLAYTRPTTFVTLVEPNDLDARISATILRRAQDLGSEANQVRITRVARADLDETPGVETIVEASSWPPFTSADTGHSIDFAGIFVLSESGQPLGEIFGVGGREGEGSRASLELVAIAKNPFDDSWDFLVDWKYLSAPEVDDDADVDEAGESSSRPEQTFYRWVKVQRYSAGHFKRRMDWIQSKTCLGADCFD